MSKRHADSTSDENPSKRRRCAATLLQSVCHACRAGDDVMELLVKILSGETAPGTRNVRSPLDAYDDEGVTPLMICARYNRIKCLSLLLDAGAGMDVASPSGMTALHFAAKGNLDCLSELITRGASVGAVDSGGNTALHYAALSDSSAVAILLKHGASVDAHNGTGSTPLRIASNCGNRGAVVSLLESGASMSFVDFTALHVAIDPQIYEQINALPHSHLNVSHIQQYRKAVVVHELLKHGAPVDQMDSLGRTPLHAALQCWNKDAILALLNAGASVASVDGDGNTPLHIATGKAFDDPDASLVHLLLNQGASVNAVNRAGEGVLQKAFNEGHRHAVAALVAAGAHVVRG